MKLFSQYRGLKKENYILFFGRLVTNLGSMVWPMLTLMLTEKLGYSATGASLVMIMSGVIMLPVSLLGGTLADRRNKKSIIITCDIISVSLYLLCACIPFSNVSLLLIITAAACQNLEHPAYNGIIADITLTRDRERAYSLQYLGMNIGFVAAPTIAGFLFRDYLWLCFLISGIAIGISTLLIWLKVKDITPLEEHSKEAEYQQVKGKESLMKVLFSSGALILYLIVSGLYHGAYMQYSYLMPIDLSARHGSAGSVIFGTITSVNCITCVLMTPLLTRLFAKYSHPFKTLLGVFFLGAGFALFLLPFNLIPLYYAATFLFTLGEIFSTIASGPYLSHRVSAAHRGRINGFFSLLQGLFQGVCMFVTGLLYDNTGSSRIPWIFVLCVLGCAVLLCLILIKADRRRYPLLYSGSEEKFAD
ncbi:MAG: hypothetical protein CW338_10585 [Clostridiales bacterium]|nr:hypothetical protein [Clostridiales bacterium]